VQVEQGHDLADLRGLPAPGGEDLGRELFALARLAIDPLVVHLRCLHRNRPGGGGHRPLAVVAVADHQTATGLVPLARQFGYVLVDFGFQSRGEHPTGALTDDVVHQGAALGGAVLVDYAQHGRAFPTRAATRAYSMTRSRSLGKVRPLRSARHPSRVRSTGLEHCSSNSATATENTHQAGLSMTQLAEEVPPDRNGFSPPSPHDSAWNAASWTAVRRPRPTVSGR
jgi:hypothetical protein